MENIHLVENLIHEGDWMIKMDLKDAYFSIPIHPEHHHFLSFQWQGQAYEFQCLPFGQSLAPRVFTKVTCPIVAWLRKLGMRILAYIDDIFLLAQSREEAHLQAQLMVKVFQALGFAVNFEKSLLTTRQEIEFLGVMIQSHPPAFHLPQHKLQTLRSRTSHLLQKDSSNRNVTVRKISQSIGKPNAAEVATPPALLFYRSLQAAKIYF